MKKKKFAIIAIIIVLVILLFPIRMNLKDGGSVRYKSLVYEVTKIHQLAPDVAGVKPYIDGFEIKILGVTIYRQTDEPETPSQNYFNAVVLEVNDDTILAECIECESGVISTGSQVSVNMDTISSEEVPILNIGDTIRVVFAGNVMETYPLQLEKVISIFWVNENGEIVTEPVEVNVGGDLIPMVMVNGELYMDTGKESTVEARCGMMDGEITSTVDGTEQPTKNNESNFGTGYGYQYGSHEGLIEIYMNDKWWVFATEKALASSQLMIKPETSDEIISYNGNEYKKSELSNATLHWLELSEHERIASSYMPPEFMIFEETWGITLTTESITSTSITIKCTQSGGEPTGELHTGSWYILENWTQEHGWKEMPYIIDGEIGWNDIAWIIPTDDTCEWEINWEWLYGTVPNGKYRIGKEITDFRATGDYDEAVYFVEFEIE